MTNIPIRDIPGAVVASPDPSNLIPMDNGSLMQKTTIANAVNATLPLSSQAEAEAGVDNAKRMSPLRTKQAIDAQTPAIVNAAITALNLGTMSQEDVSDYTKTADLGAVALSNDYDALDNLPTLGTAAATDASDYATSAQGALADSAVQPGDAPLVPSGGDEGQVLVKATDDDYDTEWSSIAAATAVSYAPQSLNSSQQSQARTNIGADILNNLPVSTYWKGVLDEATALLAWTAMGGGRE